MQNQHPMMSFLMLSALVACSCRATDVYSDIHVSETVRAEDVSAKHDAYWARIEEAAMTSKLEEHKIAFLKAELALEDPELKGKARDLLLVALDSAQLASEMLFEHNLRAANFAAEEGMKGVDEDSVSYSSGSGAGVTGYIQDAYMHFTGRHMAGQAARQVGSRQKSTVPLLRKTATVASSLLSACRAAKEAAFGMLKVDIYEKGSPKTPKTASEAAYALVDVQSQVRHKFLHFVVDSANALADDAKSVQSPDGEAVERKARVAAAVQSGPNEVAHARSGPINAMMTLGQSRMRAVAHGRGDVVNV